VAPRQIGGEGALDDLRFVENDALHVGNEIFDNLTKSGHNQTLPVKQFGRIIPGLTSISNPQVFTVRRTSPGLTGFRTAAMLNTGIYDRTYGPQPSGDFSHA
jgi:hypothetical protein